MKRLGIAFLAGLAISWLGQQLQLSPEATAAPADVFGSPNVAVDVYRNRNGTYVVWSDGRITDASNPGQDLGHPFRNPDSSARLPAPNLSRSGSQGSPNVAVKALSRGDGTFILFSNGSIKAPSNSRAAAGALGSGRVVQWNSIPNLSFERSLPAHNEDFTVSDERGAIIVRFEEALGPNPKATGFFVDTSWFGDTPPLGGPKERSMNAIGQFSADGRTVTFLKPTLANPFQPLGGFSFIATSD